MRITTGTINDVYDQDANLVLAFGTRETLSQPNFAGELTSRFPQAIVAGCSTAGQFLQDDIVDDEALLSTFHMDHSEVRSASTPLSDAAESMNAGKILGKELTANDLVAVLVLSDGINCNGSALVEGIASVLDDKATIFGGLAADQSQFEKTVILADGQVNTECVVAIGFYGDRLAVSTGSEGGWEIFGPERKITKSSLIVSTSHTCT